MKNKGHKTVKYLNFWWLVIIGSGIVASIHFLYFVIDNGEISYINIRTPHVLFILLGIFSAVILAGAMALYLLRRQVPVFPEDFSPEGESFRVQTDRDTRLRQHAYWFIYLRWLAITIALPLIVISNHVVNILPRETFIPLMTLISILALSNLVFTLWLRIARSHYFFIMVQLLSDLVILTGLLHFSGGLENPLFLIYSFHVIISGILLTKRASYSMVLTACGLLGIMVLGEYYNYFEHYSILIFPHGEGSLQHAAHNTYFILGRFASFAGTLYCLSYFTTLIMDKLRKNEENLIHLARAASTERQKLETVVNSAGAGMLLLDRELKVLWFNKKYQEWFDRGDQILGKQCGLSGNLDIGRSFCESCVSARAVEMNAPHEVERKIFTPRQGDRFFHVTASPIQNETGEITFVIELIQDITAKKTMESELRKAQTTLMKAERLAAVGELAAEVSHEVRNPLNSLSINLQLLKRELKKDDCGDEQMRKALVKILEDEIKRVDSVVGEFAKFCKVPKLELRECDINLVVSDVLELIGEEASRGGINIEVERETADPMVARMDVDQMRQVILNLVMNSIGAMSKGGRLTITTGIQNDGHIKINVEDTGEGISQENMEEIFKPFFTTKPNGTGLGLTITSRIIKEHQGSIRCQSVPGKGSDFEVILPYNNI